MGDRTMKLLIGGSPCTHWSIAQTKNRETEPEGVGWELFKNYLIALEKFKPDFFLYENNKSMNRSVQEQITEVLGVQPILINSDLVSAQSRKRLYWVGKKNPDGTYSRVAIQQPEDRGILLQDILETKRTDWRAVGRWTKHAFFTNQNISKLDALKTVQSEKSFTLTTKKGHPNNYICNPERTEYSNLTISEYEILQTIPVGYTAGVPETERYKMIGNGWTIEVVVHILSYLPGIKTEKVEVLSMYDGISCGQLALNKLGAHVDRYYATEIDKYAVKITQHNFPDTIQLGDAFQVRDDGWSLPGTDVSGGSKSAGCMKVVTS